MLPSYWEKSSFFQEADIVIAGSGFVGLWSAYFLKKKYPRLRITIIDRGFIPTGASTRNAGFACFGSVTELMKDVHLMGEDNMRTLVEMRYRGLARIRKTFGKVCDYKTTGGYELIPEIQKERYSELKDQVKWLNHCLEKTIGHKKVFRFSNNAIAEFGFAGISHIISNKLEGYLHPGKLCLALLNKVQGMGVTYLPATEITHFEEHQAGITLFTNRDLALHGSRLLVCTNGFARQLLPQLDVVPARGQVLMTAPIENLKIRGTFHYDEGYYYFRNVGKRLLLGGARNLAIDEETTTDMNTSDLIQQTLERFIQQHLLPGTPFEITDRWGGIMGMGSEKMPIVKKLTSSIYCAVKMSGMGVALAPIVAEEVREMIS